jgi:hypothetical protein
MQSKIDQKRKVRENFYRSLVANQPTKLVLGSIENFIPNPNMEMQSLFPFG